MGVDIPPKRLYELRTHVKVESERCQSIAPECQIFPHNSIEQYEHSPSAN
ncbi:hypothetical protein [Hydrococcus rivularis]|nr:hypothetical protein [Hydrococcus rivularis]